MVGYDLKEAIKNGKGRDLPLNLQLLQFVKNNPEISKQIKSQAENLLKHITGTQLQNRQTDNFIQFHVNLPLPLPEQTIDVSFQMKGKKDTEGNLDKNYCHILLDLQMPHLGRVLTHMTIQNRVVSLQVNCDASQIEQMAINLIEPLKTKLLQHEYQLSSIKFDKLTKAKKQNNPLNTTPYHPGGLDVKI